MAAIPKREGSVMENLVDMRDHLKTTRAAMQAGVDPLRAASGHRNPTGPAADPKDRRDLEERLARDRASLGIRLEEAEREMNELCACRDALEAIAAELAALPEADAATIADLRFRYQQATGRLAAMRSASTSAVGASEAEPKGAGAIWREAIPVVLAILLGSAVIALTMVLLFR